MSDLSMSSRTLDVERSSAIMSTAVAMSAAVAHLMELPAKRRYEAALYVRLLRTLYELFGKAAGPIETFAVGATVAFAWATRRQRPALFARAATGAACVAAAHAVYWTVVQPVNVEMLRWPLEAIPADWKRWRDRWEYGHAMRAALLTFALGTLTWSDQPR